MALKIVLTDSSPIVLAKDSVSAPIVKPTTELSKAMPSGDIKAYLENPLRMAEATEYKNKPSSLSYGILYQMSVRNSVVGAVINTRVNQVSAFSQPARFSDDNIGFKIRLRDPKAIPTKEQEEVMLSLEKFIENCGYQYNTDRDSFDTFIRKLVRDSLTYDQTCFEIIPDRKGRPAEIVAVDAATIRAASNEIRSDLLLEPRMNTKGDIKWVQVINGTVVATFNSNELAFGVRNPRTNIDMQPYGFSELEQLITQVTSHLYAEEYNSKFFSQGGTTKGILNLKSDPNGIANKEQLESFKRQWRAQVNGMTGAWKTPVVQIPQGIEYINVSQSNREMEFEKWMNYLVNIVCAIYQIDPAEVNFPNNGGVAGNGGSVFESSQEVKLKNSKDKGLKPLLRFIESLINKFIISRFSQEYVFCFTGINDKTEEERAQLDGQQIKLYKTVNEARREHDMDPIDDGDVILDPSWLNYHAQQAMMNSGDDGGGEENEESDWDNDSFSNNSNTEGEDNEEYDDGSDTEEYETDEPAYS